ncbi:MAG: RNA methyltransferase [Candidatus Heimdallarchaeota archaeon]
MQKTPRFHIVLVEPKYEMSVGAIARVIKNFDMCSLVLVNSQVDLDAEITRRFAMHAQEVLDSAEITFSLKSAIENMDLAIGTTSNIGGDYNLQRIAIPPEELIPLCDYRGEIAIIFGREDSGLTNIELEQCDVVMTIPTASSYSTLNLVNAVAIVLYVLYRAWIPFTPKKYRLGNRMEKKVALNVFMNLLERIKYPAHKQQIARMVFKSILGRSYLTGRELHTLIGLLRRIISFKNTKSLA